LGAQPADVLRMIVREAIVLAGAGAIIGMIAAYGVGRWMESLLAGLSPADAITFGVTALVAIIMTLSGSLVPAVRALRIDPAAALRTG
jgi:ABC-type antimicrobial peptide transport system permease subunit